MFTFTLVSIVAALNPSAFAHRNAGPLLPSRTGFTVACTTTSTVAGPHGERQTKPQSVRTCVYVRKAGGK